MKSGDTCGKEFTLLSQNIRSLKANHDKLEDLIRKEKLHKGKSIIALQEVVSPSKSMKIVGYHQPVILRRDRRKGGGLGFYISEDLQ